MDMIKASADVGNSSTKVIVNDGEGVKARKQPTTISFLPMVPQFEDDELDVLIANLHKNIVVHFTSRATVQNGLFAIGDAAINRDGTGFNIRHHKKSERDLTVIQPMSMIAVSSIQNIYKKTGVLPNTLNLNIEYATAIPVVDYTKADAKALEDRLKGEHVLILYISEDHRVTITINIKAVKVVQEGIPAFYALIGGPDSYFSAYNERYKTIFSGKNFTNRKLLFADIGDGTLELIYIEKGRPIVAKSSGERMGVGHASEKAAIAFKNQYKFNSEITRVTLMEKVLNTNDKWHNEAKQVLKTALFEQENKIFDAIVGSIENTLMYDVDDVVIFGGGTNVFPNLQAQLIEYANRYKLRVLWLDGKESPLLNAIGLDDLNNKVFFNKN